MHKNNKLLYLVTLLTFSFIHASKQDWKPWDNSYISFAEQVQLNSDGISLHDKAQSLIYAGKPVTLTQLYDMSIIEEKCHANEVSTIIFTPDMKLQEQDDMQQGAEIKKINKMLALLASARKSELIPQIVESQPHTELVPLDNPQVVRSISKKAAKKIAQDLQEQQAALKKEAHKERQRELSRIFREKKAQEQKRLENVAKEEERKFVYVIHDAFKYRLQEMARKKHELLELYTKNKTSVFMLNYDEIAQYLQSQGASLAEIKKIEVGCNQIDSVLCDMESRTTITRGIDNPEFISGYSFWKDSLDSLKDIFHASAVEIKHDVVNSIFQQKAKILLDCDCLQRISDLCQFTDQCPTLHEGIHSRLSTVCDIQQKCIDGLLKKHASTEIAYDNLDTLYQLMDVIDSHRSSKNKP